MFRILEKKIGEMWRKTEMKLDAIPSQNPCFPKTNWHSKGGLLGYLSKIGVFQKKNRLKSIIPKSQIFPGTAGLLKNSP